MTSAKPATAGTTVSGARPLDQRLRVLGLVPLSALVVLGLALVVLVLGTSWSGLAKTLACLAVVLVAAGAGALGLRLTASIRASVERLRADARRTVEETLPASIQRLRTEGPGSARSIPTAVEPESDDQLGDVAESFNELHATAVRVAAEQAALRANLDSIVVNLSRRTQTLIDRQLVEITDLESREADPDRLGQLFRIDHLATRVRRHAESLLVLAGVEERRTTRAAPALDVVRIAVGEVEQYQRVRFGVVPGDLVTAGAVDDVAHMLAELIDNATEFSPPETEVLVSGLPLIGGGLRIEVADTGIGLKPEQLEMLNARLRDGGELDVASSRTLGLYVVSRLANRHGVGVRLTAGPERGTLAQIDLPARLLVNALDVDTPLADVSAEPTASSTPGSPTLPTRPTPGTRTQPAETPLFSSVESAWFTPEAEPESLFDAGRPTPARSTTDASPSRDAWTAGGHAGPAASSDEPILSSAGLPRRRRGAALAPGALPPSGTTPDPATGAGDDAGAAPGSPMPHQQRRRPDAAAVSSVLSTLQSGVSRARSDATGWVPEESRDTGGSSDPAGGKTGPDAGDGSESSP